MSVLDSKNTKKDRFSELIEVLREIAKDKWLLREFLVDILTPREIEEISNRWQIVKMLKAQIPHHIIAHKLRVGVETVTRGSREMSNGRGGFQLTLAKLKK